MQPTILPLFLILEYLLILKLRFQVYIDKNPPINWEKGQKGNVILIHGLHETWVFLKKIGELANKLGYKVYVVKDLKNNTIQVDEGAKIIKAFLKRNKIKKATFISHSKGGINVRLLLNNNQSLNKFNLICIATPHNGSQFARLVKSESQLIPNSTMLNKINSMPSNNSNIINIFPSFDNHVLPNSSLYLKGANNIKINIVGHTRILFNSLTMEVVKNLLYKGLND